MILIQKIIEESILVSAMTKRFLGWDCANKTLAWSYFNIDTHIYSKMSILCDNLADLVSTYMGPDILMSLPRGLNDSQREHFCEVIEDPQFMEEFMDIIGAMEYFTDNFITYLSSGVVDVLGGRKVSECDEIERSHALHKFLNSSADVSMSALASTNLPLRTIIEHQPSKIGTKTNNKSTMVGHQLMFYYINHQPTIVDPKLKNNIMLSVELPFERFLMEELPKHKDRRDAVYTARKRHSRENFLHMLRVFGCMNVIENVPKSCLDDLADSSMQVLAWLVTNKQFV